MRNVVALVAFAWLLAPSTVDTQSSATSRYRVISTNRLPTLQKELDQAAGDGYRVIASARPAPALRVVVLERSKDKYEYFISDAAATAVRDQKVQPGFRILPQTVGSASNSPCGAVFERSGGDVVRRDYRVADAVYPGNLQKDILEATAEGYRVLVAGAAAGFCAVLEREHAGSGGGAATTAVKDVSAKEKKVNLSVADYSRPYVLLATTRTSTLEKEMADAVAHGFRLHSGSAADELVYLMERQDASAPRADYVVLSTNKRETLEREMNQAAARGYRLHPFSLAGILRSMSGTFETIAVMEKRESPAIEYRVIATARAGTFEKELSAALEQGWDFVAMPKSGALMAVVQRLVTPR